MKVLWSHLGQFGSMRFAANIRMHSYFKCNRLFGVMCWGNLHIFKFPKQLLANMGSSRWISLIGCGPSAFSISDDLVSFSKTAVPFTFSIRHFPKCCCGPRQNANSKVRQLSLGVPLFKMLLWSTRGSKFPSTSSYVTQCYHQNHTKTTRKSIKVGLSPFCRCASIVLLSENLQ